MWKISLIIAEVWVSMFKCSASKTSMLNMLNCMPANRSGTCEAFANLLMIALPVTMKLADTAEKWTKIEKLRNKFFF